MQMDVHRCHQTYSIILLQYMDWATQTDTNARKFKRVQALALRMMSGAMPSTPFIALNHLTNTPDIILFLRGEAAKGTARLQAYGSLTLETIAPRKGTITTNTTINKQFMLRC